MGRKREGVGRALQHALGKEFVLPEVEPREGGRSLLMNPRRQRVFEYVWNNPCSHLRRISRELRIPAQSLRWHLTRLVEGKILAARTARGKTVYYAPWAVREGDVPALAALSNGVRAQIVRHVAQAKRTTQTNVFRALHTYQQAVLPPLRELTGFGLLTTWKANGKRYYEMGETYARLRSDYAGATQERLDRLLAVLKRDGVSPKVQDRSDDEVQVQVSAGPQKSVLRLGLSPVLR
jgi:predicted ArsR family transcriptional regulator